MNSKVHDLLIEELAKLPKLPSKFGYAIDCGQTRFLTDTPADIHFENAHDQSVIMRADGLASGQRVPLNELKLALYELLKWFLNNESISETHGRMRTISHELPAHFMNDKVLSSNTNIPLGGQHIGIAYGELRAELLDRIANENNKIQITPWRSLILENVPHSEALIANQDDPRRAITICTGSPKCLAGYQQTKSLANTIAANFKNPIDVHISGCEKRCASQAPHALNLIGTPSGFDLFVAGEQTPSNRISTPNEAMLYIKENHAS